MSSIIHVVHMHYVTLNLMLRLRGQGAVYINDYIQRPYKCMTVYTIYTQRLISAPTWGKGTWWREEQSSKFMRRKMWMWM